MPAIKLRPRRLGPGLVAIAAMAFVATPAGAQSRSLVDFVNTLQGTNSSREFSRGNTIPAVARPNGMQMWTPQTGPNGDGWKYQFEKTTIRGFQQSHQCSPWSNDYAVFSLMPVVGPLVVDDDRRAVGFRHDDELARPHRYRVALASGVVAELAPTVRGACLRFAFPARQGGYLVLDGYTGECEFDVRPAAGRIVGWVRNGRNLPPNFRAYFVIDFGRPLDDFGAWQRGQEPPQPGATHCRGRNIGAYVRVAPGETLTIRTATSYISREQALVTLERELGGYATFDDAAAAAERAWSRRLGRLLVEGDAERQATFYSCLYRASLFPRKFYEFAADGRPHYRSPFDGRVHDGFMFTDTGLWDTFRAQMPLNALVRPALHGRYVQSLLAAHREGGWLPAWTFPGEAGSMIGNHAISLLADAWAKGLRTFDPAEALAAYRHEANAKGPRGPANGRDGFRDYNERGYVPFPEVREATAKTLEYAYDDFCGYALARATGQREVADELAARMFNYRRVYDAETGFMRGRNRAGQWTTPFDPVEWGGPFVEGCAWHWTWSVFHDPAGLIDLMGGEAAFVARLDAVWRQPGEFRIGSYDGVIHEMREMAADGLGQYAHGNQPMQHMPYLYAYAGQPWKTQQHVRNVMARLYDASENGYPGDEDQGQTSSWFVLSALGLYSVCPGVPEYVLGSPAFPRATIRLGEGKQFVIRAEGHSPEAVYIESATLNDVPYSRSFLRHEDIVRGGELVLRMSQTPNLDRGTTAADRPFSVSTHELPTAENDRSRRSP
jgi:predicted alpha-1,2-mannosidase